MAENIHEFMKGFDNLDQDFGFKAISEEEVEQAKKQSETLQQVSETSASMGPQLQNIETKLDQVLLVANQKYEARLEEKELELEVGNKEKFENLEKLILPLLYNLGKSEETYIYWPNRQQVIQEQITKIIAITRTET